MLSLFQFITYSLLVLLEGIKLFAIINWIFHMPDIWKSIIFFKKL